MVNRTFSAGAWSLRDEESDTQALTPSSDMLHYLLTIVGLTALFIVLTVSYLH